MKICHVNLASGFSGGEQQTLQLIKRQVRDGLSPVLIANIHGSLAYEAKRIGCHVITTKHFTRKHSKKITQDCDVIHVHEGRGIYWALIQNLRHGIPYIITRRIDNPIKLKLTNKIAYKRASALVGLSSAIKARLEENFDSNKIHTIPSSPVSYPIDQNKLDQIWNRYRGKFIIIQAAKMLPHKGFETTIQAAYHLNVTDPKIQFILIGDGPYCTEYKALAKGLTNVTFVGKQSDMGTWFAAANLFVHPALSEGLGSVILEAMQAGVPVIASNAGGIPDIVENNVTGLMFEAGNHLKLIEKIQDIYTDTNLGRRLALAAKDQLKNFDIAHTSSLYMDIYQEIIQPEIPASKLSNT